MDTGSTLDPQQNFYGGQYGNNEYNSRPRANYGYENGNYSRYTSPVKNNGYGDYGYGYSDYQNANSGSNLRYCR